MAIAITPNLPATTVLSASTPTPANVATPPASATGPSTPGGLLTQAVRPPPARHPVTPSARSPFTNAVDKTIYLPRTDNWKGLTPQARKDLFVRAMRDAGPKGKLEIEVLGSYGNHIGELKGALRDALAEVPAAERPQIVGFFSGFHPVPPDQAQALDTSLYEVAQAQHVDNVGTLKDGRRVIDLTDPKVFGVVQDQISQYLAFAKEMGLRPDITVDDNFAVPKEFVSKFLTERKLSATQGRALFTQALSQIASQVNAAGGRFTLSLVGSMAAARDCLIDAPAIATGFNPKAQNQIEFQVYRSNETDFSNTLKAIRTEINGNAKAMQHVAGFRIAVGSQADGAALSQKTMKAQLDAYQTFKTQLGKRWDVTLALFTHGSFYPLPVQTPAKPPAAPR
jgi:hypothetical protein